MSNKEVHIQVIKGEVLGIELFRGYAPLSILSKISKPDVYDAEKNPQGTQRDLSPKHAKEAYEYARFRDFAFWPEVFLCVRDESVFRFQSGADNKFGEIIIDLGKIETHPDTVYISRVDGNHRLFYADGLTEGYEPIEKEVSFCITEKLDINQEIILFRDINNNQRRMNTSHLDNIEFRLSEEESMKKLNPALYISKKLGTDSDSPFYQRIFDGGKKKDKYQIPLRSLNTGITYMFSRPTKLNALKDPEAQLKLIKNFFIAFKNWVPDSWNEPGKYIPLRGVGLWAICFIGAEVIDRVLEKGKFDSEDMYFVLKSGKNWDWSVTGDFSGYSGRGGAIKIRDMVVNEFVSDKGISLKDLYNRIMEK